MQKTLIQIAAWAAVLLVLGNIVTYPGAAYKDQSGSCILAPWLCTKCHDCDNHILRPVQQVTIVNNPVTIINNPITLVSNDPIPYLEYHFPLPGQGATFQPDYAFSYYQNHWNYGGFDGRNAMFSSTPYSTGPIAYGYHYYDPSSGWSYDKNSIFSGGEELYSNQRFGW